MATKTKIPLKKMAQYRHVKFLIAQEKMALLAFNFVSAKLLIEVKKLLKQEKLAKSDDDTLKPGWTGEIPKIDIDLNELLSPVLDKHMEALRYALLGNYAGPEAKKAAEEVGLADKITPGIIPASYIQSLDAHREHFVDLFGIKSPELPRPMMKETLSTIVKRADRFINQLVVEYKNKIVTTVEGVKSELDHENINKAFEAASDLALSVGGEEAVQSAAQDTDAKIDRKELTKEMQSAFDSFENRFETVARAQAAQASAVATHQSVLEIYGSQDGSVRLVNLEMQDELVCTFCRKISKNADGTWIYYKLGDLQTSGYNFSRKRPEWLVSIAPQHHRCRCQSVYVPNGFELDKNGTITPVKK